MIPVRRLLGQAIYYLHWPPHVFWAATLHEIEAAMEAAEAHDERRDDDKPSKEFIALRDAHLAREKR